MPASSLTIALDAGTVSNAVLIGEERGLDIEWRPGESGDWRPASSRPPRYGTFAAVVAASSTLQLRALPSAPRTATVRLKLVCGDDPEAAALPACLADLAASPQPGEGNWCKALRLHDGANAANRAGDLNLALSRYEQVEQAWRARGDDLRAAAAQLGRVESLLRLNRFADAEVAAEQAEQANQRAGNAYFAARARNEACVAYRERGQRKLAQDCLAQLPPKFIALGEIADAATSYYNLASMAQEDGMAVDAVRWLRAARSLDPRFVSPEIRARLDLIEGSLAITAGNLAGALEAYERAAQAFERLRDERWLGNTYLRIGILYSQLGALPEAEAYVRDALQRRSSALSTARQADALRQLAMIEFDLGDTAAAGKSFATARSLLVAQGAPLIVTALDLDQALRGDAAALQRAAAALAEDAAAPPRLRARLALAQADHQLRSGAAELALAASRRLAAEPLTFADYVHLKTVQARTFAASGKSAEAYALLDQEISALRRMAASSSAAALRQIAGRHLAELRKAWVDVYLAQDAVRRPAPEQLWNRLRDTAPASLMPLRTAAQLPANESSEANRQLAQVLLDDSGSSSSVSATSAQRALQRYYAALEQVSGAPGEPAVRPRSLAQLQAGLDVGGRLLVFGFGTRAGVVLSLTRDHVAVHEVASAGSVRAAAAALRAAVAQPQSATAEIRDAAMRVSAALLAGHESPPPKRLLVLADTAFDGIPWGLLTWPGQTDWLVATTPVALFAAEPREQRPQLAQPQRIGVLVADNADAAASAALPRLYSAALEPDWIAGALPQTAVVRLDTSDDARRALADALGSAAAWVHVAAHGSARTRLQSYSGIWLDAAAPGQPPQLYSWLDVADRPVRAALVVLDACALAAADPRASAGAMSFAAALSAAGAQQVVAALWPVSDGAARIWVPAFYSTLAAGEARDVGEALRQAQLRLRASVQFRHPFYWASWVHFTQ